MIKYIHIIFTGLFLLANLVICGVIPGISTPAIIASFAVILLNGIAAHLTKGLEIKDGYKISLPFFFISCGLLEYVLSFFMKDHIQGNFAFLGVSLLVLLEAATAITCIAISRHNKAKE